MDDDSAGDKFCEEDIEQILKGRTQVIQIESEGKGSTFSKVHFQFGIRKFVMLECKQLGVCLNGITVIKRNLLILFMLTKS